MGENFEEIVGLVLYGLFLLARRLYRKRQSDQPAPAPIPEVALPRPVPATSTAPAPTAPAPKLPRPWREIDRRAADLAALPTPWGIAQGFQQAGRLYFRSTPGLEPELRARMGLPRAAPLPDSTETLVARHLAVPMGPWLETLFADTWAALLLGPAYAVGLRRTLVTEGHEPAVTILSDEQGNYAAIPPPHLRVLLCCDLLSFCGHKAEASRQITLWHGEIGAVEGFILPTRGGDWADVPVDLVRAFGARVQELIAAEPLASLGGASLASLDGLRFTPADQSAAEQAATLLATGMLIRVAPRVALAAALLAADDADGREREILVALRRSLAPAAEAVVSTTRALTRRSERPAAPGGAFLDLSPAGLREAMIARAILCR